MNVREEANNRKWFNNVNLIGEIDDGTSVYIEDYAYTYLKHYANSDLSYELCAVLIGEHRREANQIIIYGVIYIDYSLLDGESCWISENILGEIEDQRQCYFPQGDYVGWMHTQPGYGLMPTSKEMSVHKDMFGDECILMLIDPLHNLEAFFTCNKDKFEEKKGFCIYYEKNEQMQCYMEDSPFLPSKVNNIDDKVVNEFRNLGTKWKQEVERRNRISRTICVTIAGILVTLIFILGMQDQQKRINQLEHDLVNIYKQYGEK